MRLSLLCDVEQDSGIDKVLLSFSDLGLRSFFADRNYGQTLAGITIVLICQNPCPETETTNTAFQNRKRSCIWI